MIYPENFEAKISFSEIRSRLMSYCLSPLGTEQVGKMQFMTDARLLNRKLKEVSEFRSILSEGDFPSENFFDVRASLLWIRPEGTFLEEDELFDLKRSLETITNIRNFLSATGEGSQLRYPTLSLLCEGLQVFPQIAVGIGGVLNKFGKLKDDASPELARIRREKEMTVRSIARSLQNILASARQDGLVEKDAQPALRDGRLVIPIAPALKRKIKGIVHDESASGKTVFVEPEAVVDANNKIRELEGEERREVIRILRATSDKIRPHIENILPAYRFLGVVDFTRAKAQWANETKGVDLQVSGKPVVDWVQAVHPLLQESLARHGKKMEPLDIRLTPEHRMLIISGPNAGGKSVCLKTTGLLQYMLQCGLPIPVRESSKTGIFKSLFMDIGDEQSLENDLSTYSGHLLNMKAMLKNADSQSLLLIDEFGGGTEPRIGGAIAEAILNKFTERGIFGVITTHYQNLKQYADAHSGTINGAMLYDRQNMKPLFQLQIGQPGSSFAIEIARQTGLPQDVIDTASDIVGREYIQSDKYLQDIVRDKRYWENKRQNIHLREKQLEQIVARYEKEISDLQKERKSIVQKAKAEAKLLLESSNAKIENTIRGIKEAQAERENTRRLRSELDSFKNEILNAKDGDSLIEQKIEKIRQRKARHEERKRQKELSGDNAAVSKLKEVPLKEIVPGDMVRIKGQESVGVLREQNNQHAVVELGNMRVVVKPGLLEYVSPSSRKEVKSTPSVGKGTQEAMYNKKLSFRPEIDVRGMRGDEALQQVTYFVDDAILLGVSPIRVLHGTGNGILRNLIRGYLSTVPNVTSYHDEHIQLGGHGITVINLE